MKIFDDIKTICKTELESDFTFECLGNFGLAFEGNYKIEQFDSEIIKLNLFKNRFMIISGKNLVIGTLAPKEIGINGTIISIAFEGKLC